jgi:hypothetical protein
LLSGAGAGVVRSVNLLKIAAEAEVLRYRCMVARQGRRAAFGAVALVFVLAVLVLGEVAAWLGLCLRFTAVEIRSCCWASTSSSLSRLACWP